MERSYKPVLTALAIVLALPSSVWAQTKTQVSEAASALMSVLDAVVTAKDGSDPKAKQEAALNASIALSQLVSSRSFPSVSVSGGTTKWATNFVEADGLPPIRIVIGRPASEDPDEIREELRELDVSMFNPGSARWGMAWVRDGVDAPTQTGDSIEVARFPSGVVFEDAYVVRSGLDGEALPLRLDNAAAAAAGYATMDAARRALGLSDVIGNGYALITCRWKRTSSSSAAEPELSYSLADYFDEHRVSSDVRRRFRAAVTHEIRDLTRWVQLTSIRLRKYDGNELRGILNDVPAKVDSLLESEARTRAGPEDWRRATLELLRSRNALGNDGSPIESAMYAGDVDAIQELLGALNLRLFPRSGSEATEQRIEVLKQLFREFRFSLHSAVLADSLEMTRVLVLDACHPLARLGPTERSLTPFHVAALIGNRNVVTDLLPANIIHRSMERSKRARAEADAHASIYADLDAPKTMQADETAPFWWAVGYGTFDPGSTRPLPRPAGYVEESPSPNLERSDLTFPRAQPELDFTLYDKLSIRSAFEPTAWNLPTRWDQGDIAGLNALDYAIVAGHTSIEALLTKLGMESSIPPEERSHPLVTEAMKELRAALEGLPDLEFTPPEPAPPEPPLPEELANFRTTTTDGKNVSIADYSGKVLIIHFWATWCNPCRPEIDLLKELYSGRHDDGLEILGLCVDVAPATAAERFGIPWPELSNGQHWSQKLGVQAYPSSFVIDRTGRLRAKDQRNKQLVALTKELLAE